MSPLIILKAVTVFILMILSCSPDVKHIISGEIGSNLSVDGEIEGQSLEYIFPRPKNRRTNKDLFHYIYFKGDTVCFSFLTNFPVKGDKVMVWFVQPETGKRFPAERIDIENERVNGFSLLGTLMAQFHKKRLEKTIPSGAFCCKPISFTVVVTIQLKGRSITSRLTDAFIIRYD